MKLTLLKEHNGKEAGTVLEVENDKEDVIAKGLIASGIAEELKEDDDEVELKKVLAEAIEKGVKIELAKQVKAIAKSSKDPAGLAQVHDNYEDDPYGACKNIGAWLKEAVAYNQTKVVSDNFKKALALTDAGNESIGADGGIVIPDFLSAEILKQGMVNSDLDLMSESMSVVVSGNSVTWPILDNADQSAASTRFVGVEVAWTEEIGVKTKSKPKFSQTTVALKKLTAFVPVSDELLEDVPAIQSMVQSQAGIAIIDTVNQAIVDGDGNGKPTGWIGHSGTVSSPTDANRTTSAPITVSGVTGMYDRLLDRANAKWIVNQELRSPLSQLKIGDHGILSASNLEGAPFQFMLGIPVTWTDIAKAPATEGDISLVNMRGYKMATKGGVKSQISIHFFFDQDATVFRFVIRVNGQPAFKDAVTPLNGAEKMSNFITLNTTA